jgi:ABC-type Fe3+-hydroxamate transport system substrate-binding protein
MGASVVGITDYCIHPADKLVGLPRLGGPKNPHIEDILHLNPDLVLANWEENTPQSVDALEAAGVPVWVTFPKTIRQSIDILWTLAGIYESSFAAMRLETLEIALDWAVTASAGKRGIRYFCPIWFAQDVSGIPWWMTFNQDTYCHDVLKAAGGENIFAQRQRRYPLQADLGMEDAEAAGERDVRYPRVTLTEIQEADPEIVILPSEPYEFTADHCEEIRRGLWDTSAVRENKIFLVDGTLITWSGTRLAHTLRDLPPLFAA